MPGELNSRVAGREEIVKVKHQADHNGKSKIVSAAEGLRHTELPEIRHDSSPAVASHDEIARQAYELWV